jgi:hypothetical protein
MRRGGEKCRCLKFGLRSPFLGNPAAATTLSALIHQSESVGRCGGLRPSQLAVMPKYLALYRKLFLFKNIMMCIF